MKTIVFSLIILLQLGCQQSATSNQKQQTKLQELFTLNDAEGILGESAHLKDSTLTIKPEVSAYESSYFADSVDQATGKTGAIYVMIEDYKDVSSAQDIYSSIKTSNANHEGVKVLDDIGDEAYFHSDGQNFMMIIVRKKGTVLRIKVNKITSHTSKEEFNKIARRIIERL